MVFFLGGAGDFGKLLGYATEKNDPVETSDDGTLVRPIYYLPSFGVINGTEFFATDILGRSEVVFRTTSDEPLGDIKPVGKKDLLGM